MTAILKLITFFLLLLVFIYESSLLYVDNLSFQIICLCVVLLACLLRFGKTKLINEIRLLLPFILTMLSVYLLLGVLGIRIALINDSQSTFMYWLKYGLSRTILFINTMFFIQVLLSYISMQDILSLPMQMNKKRYLLLGRALFVHSIQYIEALEFHLKLMPEYQKPGLTLLQWFRLKLQLSLAVIMMVLRESKIKGELIDNRILHCFKEQIGRAK
jgi:hypothetical protein